MQVKKFIRAMTRVIPDKPYLCLDYFRTFGKFPNLKMPKTYNEKLQWLKLHDRRTEYTQMVDKYEAKKFVAEHIGEEHIIPNYGVWDSFDEIDFDALPMQFVLKCTHDCGGLVICRDKNKLDRDAARKKITACLKRNYFWQAREWPYKHLKPRIIAEQYLDDENSAKGLTDYKFFCFNGNPKMVYISQGLEDHATARISFFDMNGKRMPFTRKDYLPIEEDPMLPANFGEMACIAEKMARAIQSAFVRIDLYSVYGQVKFSEITFFPCGGMMPFSSESWNRELGDWIELPSQK